MKDLKYHLDRARKTKRAIGQFNFSTLEQLRGILLAAKRTRSPVIVGTSGGEIDYLGLQEAVSLVNISREKYGVEAFLNLDHNTDEQFIKKAVDLGYSAVHFDGSGLSLEKNTKYAKKIARYAHKHGVLVEGELIKVGEESRFSVEETIGFIKSSQIDSFALAIGNRHGFYRSVKIDLDRLKKIRSRTDAFLVLHGGSGIDSRQIRAAIGAGIVKINVNTEIRMTWKKAFLKALKKKEVRPYEMIPSVVEAIAEIVEKKIKLFR